MKRILTAALIAVSLASVAAACGGKSKNASTSPGATMDNGNGGASYGGAMKPDEGDPCGDGSKADPCGGDE